MPKEISEEKLNITNALVDFVNRIAKKENATPAELVAMASVASSIFSNRV